ncbi:MobF family relaxase [Sinimarinibacterium flocculans]
MLTISRLRDSAAAVSYYEKDDYYTTRTESSDAQGQWWGAAAQRLGLSGAVDPDTFKNLLDGKLPNGTSLKTTQPGWDLTFSAPKSVSIMVEAFGDARLREAHERAVEKALAYLQKHSTAYRQRGGWAWEGRQRQGDNLVAALFEHHTSRNMDPQLHTHAVVANVTQRADGRWVAIESKPFYEDQKLGGMIYRAELAADAQRLGYAVEKTARDGSFELAAVPKPLIETFSTRREDIERAMAERGLTGAKAAEQAALRTRSGKHPYSREAIAEHWKAQAQEHGFDGDRVLAGALKAGDVTPTERFDDTRAILDASDRLSESEAVFLRGDLLRETLANGVGRLRLANALAAVRRYAAGGALRETRLGARDGWTTPKALEQEKRTLEAVQRGENAVSPVMSPREAAAALACTELNDGQRKAATLIATSRDRFIGVLGRPGTGKTYMLGTARQLLEGRGYALKGLAGNADAARQVARESGIESSTLRKHLNAAERAWSALKNAGPHEAAKLRAEHEKEAWVLDEASQIGSADMRKLSFLAERLGARVILIGDPQQLPAIGAGKPFAQMLPLMKHVELDELRRQTRDEHKAAVRAAIQGDIPAAMARLKPDTQEIQDRDQRLKAILERWRAAGDDRAQTLMLTARNVDKTALNDGARDILRAEGALKDETAQRQLFRVFASRADKTHAEVYQVGDVVVFGRGVQQLGIARGAYLTVAEADRKTNTVTLLATDENGAERRVDWNPKRVAGGAKNGVELYRPRDTALAVGDRIQWNRNSRDGFTNGQLLTVTACAPDGVEVQTETGERRTLDPRTHAGQHWEHAYASTVYKSQGATRSHVLVNAESTERTLFSQKAFLVAISRQKDTIKLFTDSTEDFTRNVAHYLGDKTSAIEGREESRLHKVGGYLDQLLRSFQSESAKDVGRSVDGQAQHAPPLGAGRL